MTGAVAETCYTFKDATTCPPQGVVLPNQAICCPMQIAYLVKAELFECSKNVLDFRIEVLDSGHLIGVEKADIVNPMIMEYFGE